MELGDTLALGGSFLFAAAVVFLSLFANPWMLLWGAAVGVPLYLHFRRRGNREIAWGAMRILQAVQLQHARSLQLWRLLLLLLRILLVLALALALADPVLRFSALSPFRNLEHLQIVVVDCSASMQARHAGASNFERAIGAAAETVKQAEDRQFLVFGMPGAQRSRAASIPVGRTRAQQQLEELAVTVMPVDVQLELHALAQQIKKLRVERPDFARVDLTVITDAQQSSWEDVTRDDLAELQRMMGAGSQLTVVPIATTDELANVAVHGVRLAEVPAISDHPNALVVELRNYGEEATEQSVEVARDGSTVWSRRVQLAGDETTQVEFPFQPGADPERLIVSISEDSLAADNTLALPIAPTPRIRVRQLGADGAVAQFVETAVSVAYGPAQAEVVRMPPEEGDESPRDEVVLVQSVGRMTADDRAEIVGRVRRGAGLLLCLGAAADRATARNWLQELGLDVEPLAMVEPPVPNVDPLDYGHPIAAPFRQHPDSGLTDLPVFRHWKLQQSADSDMVEVLRLSTGDPLLLAGSVGFGRALVLATPIHSGLEGDAAWNAIAVSPVFVPLLDQSLRWLLAGDVQTVDTGSSFAFDTELVDRVVAPDGNVLWSAAQTPRATGLAKTSVRALGVYRVEAGEGALPDQAGQWIVGRLNPAESDLSWRPLPQPESRVAESTRDGSRQSLLLMLIPLCGLLMLGESIVAHLIRRRFA